MRKGLPAAIAVLFALAPLHGFAEEDAEGSKDHPAVKRYPGSFITVFEEKEFETFPFPISGAAVERAEGKLHRATYSFPQGQSCTQILRNYENALRASGFEIHAGRKLPDAMDVDVSGDSFVTGIRPGKGGGKVYVMQLCGNDAPGFTPLGDLAVVETQAMSQKVEITADFLAEEIEKSGRVAVRDILFATGKADISPESEKTLEQIGALLRNRPGWRLRIEGHTDNVGNAKANLELSRKRGESVKAWLVAKHGAQASRLETAGFGDTKAVAENKTEEGRALNRRVELVKL
jgi:outer membrane protein OmpA-like peptidoglycan-associated protein